MGWVDGWIAALSDKDRELLWSDHPAQDDLGKRAAWALSSGLASEVEFNEERSHALVAAVIESGVGMSFDPKAPTWLTAFSMLLQPAHMYGLEELRRFERGIRSQLPGADPDHSPTVQKVRSLVEDFLSRCDRMPPEQVIPQIIEEARTTWGDGWALLRSAFALVTVEGRPRRAGRAVRMANQSVGLHRRVRYARSKGGATQGEWWVEEVEEAASTLEKMAIVVAALSWASKRALLAVFEPAARVLGELSEADFQRVCDLIERQCWGSAPGRRLDVSDAMLAEMPHRLALALARRDPARFGNRLYQTRYRNYRGKDPAVVAFAFAYALDDAARARDLRSANLALVRRLYRQGGAVPDLILAPRRGSPRVMSPPVAQATMKRAVEYPIELVEEAERMCSAHAGLDSRPVYAMASDQEWFSGQI
jgi:hypothetical protein